MSSASFNSVPSTFSFRVAANIVLCSDITGVFESDTLSGIVLLVLVEGIARITRLSFDDLRFASTQVAPRSAPRISRIEERLGVLIVPFSFPKSSVICGVIIVLINSNFVPCRSFFTITSSLGFVIALSDIVPRRYTSLGRASIEIGFCSAENESVVDNVIVGSVFNSRVPLKNGSANERRVI